MTTAHTIDEALARFTLVKGEGDGETTACAMSLLNWVWRNDSAGWSDAPECAHPLIRSVVIAANDDDGTTPEMRAELVRAGETGILDTWWVPTQVIAWALSAQRDAEPPSAYARCLTALCRISEWKVTKERPDLRDADLRDADLAGADLGGANLMGANLRGANLMGANLGGADLRGANLRGANLMGANLRGATLVGANLRDADLRGPDLRGATLGGANLRDANLGGANLAGAMGNQYTTLPVGWKVNDAGLIVKEDG